MQIAFVLFNRMTSLDFVGAYDAVTRLKKLKPELALRWEFCAVTDDIVDDRGLRLVPSRIGRPLEAYDLLVVPGGRVTRLAGEDVAERMDYPYRWEGAEA